MKSSSNNDDDNSYSSLIGLLEDCDRLFVLSIV